MCVPRRGAARTHRVSGRAMSTCLTRQHMKHRPRSRRRHAIPPHPTAARPASVCRTRLPLCTRKQSRTPGLRLCLQLIATSHAAPLTHPTTPPSRHATPRTRTAHAAPHASRRTARRTTRLTPHATPRHASGCGRSSRCSTTAARPTPSTTWWAAAWWCGPWRPSARARR